MKLTELPVDNSHAVSDVTASLDGSEHYITSLIYWTV